jgi:hypothetical protein
MMATKRRLRRSLAFAVVVVGFAGVFAVRGHASTPTDADVFAIQGGLTTTSAMQVVPTPVGYTVDTRTQCGVTVATTTLPGYLDVPSAASGTCTGVSGSGTLTVAGCSTGQVDGDWLIPEPGGDTAHFTGSGIMVGGLAIMATPPGGAYVDDSRTGQGAAVALIVPSGLICGTRFLNLTAVVAGAY